MTDRVSKERKEAIAADCSLAIINDSNISASELRDLLADLDDRDKRIAALEVEIQFIGTPNDWRDLETATQEALQKIGEEFGVLGGEPRTDGINRVLIEQRAKITELEAEVAILNTAVEMAVADVNKYEAWLEKKRARIASLESANAELTKKLAEAKNALKPFAKEAEAWGGSSLDDYHPGILEPNQRTAHADAEFSIGDLRHAAAILANQKGGDANEGTPSTTNTPESSPGVTAGALAQARDAALEEASEIAHDIGFQRASDGYTKAKSRTGRDKANAASRCALEIEDAIRSLKTKGE